MTLPKIIFVTGSNGGVGKSIVTMTVLDTIGPSAILVETDNSNPDVAKAHRNTNTMAPYDLDKPEGWINLVNLAHQTDSPIVINGAARSNVGLRHAPILIGALEELGRDLNFLFVMSRTLDSVELLQDHLDVFPQTVAKTWTVLNQFFGHSDRFTRYHQSQQKTLIEEHTGTLVFPNLADRVMDQLNQERLTIAQAADKLSLGDRMELQRWRTAANEALERALS